MNQLSHTIEETFQVTERGTVVVLNTATNQPRGRALNVHITRPDGTSISCEAFKEILLRHSLPPLENDAFLLKGVVKTDIPIGSTLCFV
jgi:translation elongation factor EF-Tu-like GTPase